MTSAAASKATAIGSPLPVAHLAFRVVQERLTNALRYAPGSEVLATAASRISRSSGAHAA